MDMLLRDYYKSQRELGYKAKWALSNAKTLVEWDKLNGVIVNECEYDYEYNLKVRVLKLADSDYIHMFDYDIDDGECKVEADNELIRLIELYGVVGIQAQIFNGKEWIDCDYSCWGFIDNDDTFGGYVFDCMRNAISEYKQWVENNPCRYG